MMKLRVNRTDCIGCQLCSDIAPDVFGGGTEVEDIVGEIIEDNYSAIREAEESCPVGAITIAEI